MKLSKFGQKLTGKSGILQLMDDLGKAMAESNAETAMLGGGNPAHIPQIQALLKKRMQDILDKEGEFEKMIGNYTTPQGDGAFLKALAKLFKDNYGWPITEKNVAVINGSQTAFFFLFNLIAGESSEGQNRQILLPIVPEYIGYADQGIGEKLFTAAEPEIEYLDEHTFKYHINFDNIKLDESIAAICISRPTNPTGNVVSDEELQRLLQLAKANGSYLIVDNAYGLPFPNIIFSKATPLWDENIINSFSLSKFGLPGTRSSILIASEEVIEMISRVNAIVSLASNNIGSYLTLPLVESGEIIQASKELITPFYQAKSKNAIAHIHDFFPKDLSYYVHKSEGALFLWLWFKDMPITSQELYERLKARNVLVVPGQYFFPGHDKNWRHKQECIRITYSQKDEGVERGIKTIAEEVTKAYNNK